jgi:hypothetical protein
MTYLTACHSSKNLRDTVIVELDLQVLRRFILLSLDLLQKASLASLLMKHIGR